MQGKQYNTVYDILKRNNLNNQNGVAINYYDKRIRFEKLFKIVEKVAESFKRAGVKKGKVVTICMQMMPELAYSFCALNKLGAIANLVNPGINGDKIINYIQETDSEIVVMVESCYNEISQMIAQTKVRKVVVVSIAESYPFDRRHGYDFRQKIFGKRVEIPWNSLYVSWADFIRTSEEYNREVYFENEIGMPAVITHTDEAGGESKGIIWSAECLKSIITGAMHSLKYWECRETFLDVLPGFTVFGLVYGLIIPQCIGMEVQMVPHYIPEKFATTFIKCRPNHTLCNVGELDVLYNNRNTRNMDLFFANSVSIYEDLSDNAWKMRMNKFLNERGSRAKVAIIENPFRQSFSN